MNDDKAYAHTTDRQHTLAFDSIFREHYKNMLAYACSIVKDKEAGEEIVQQIFTSLWEKRGQVQVEKSVKSYLYRTVHNRCLNYMRDAGVRAKYEQRSVVHMQTVGSSGEKTAYRDLQQKINTVLNELPEQCRTIFQLSRFEELNYQEISEQMDVSISTVKNQVAKALKLLRVRLADHLPLLLLIAHEIYK